MMNSFGVLTGFVMFTMIPFSESVPPTMPPIKLNIRKGENGESSTEVSVNLFINEKSCECVSNTEPCLLELVFPDEEEGVMATPCQPYAVYCCKMNVNIEDIEISSEIEEASGNALEEELISNISENLDKEPHETPRRNGPNSETDTLLAQKDSSDYIIAHQDSASIFHQDTLNPQDSDNEVSIAFTDPQDTSKRLNSHLDIFDSPIFHQESNNSLISQQDLSIVLNLLKENILSKTRHQKSSRWLVKRSLNENENFTDISLQEEDPARKPKMLMCSCTTTDDCINSWALIQDRPEVVVKTSLRCENPGEVTCCLGEVMPPRTLKVLHDKPTNSYAYDHSMWEPAFSSALQNFFSWILS